MMRNKKQSFLGIILVSLFFLLSFFCQTHQCLAEPTPAGKSYFIVTVDTESLLRDNFFLPLQLDTNINGEDCGIFEMVRIADKHGVKITFYLDVYEMPLTGQNFMKELAKELIRLGHDVQLHTHPEFMFDSKRLKMFDYSLDEQKMIIEKGINLLEAWTGIRPVAHRAGTYSANDDTLIALANSGVTLDSSYYFENNVCRLSARDFGHNGLTRKGGLLEIPVTVFYVNEYIQSSTINLPYYKRLKKLDIDSCTFDLMKQTVSLLQEGGVDTITLFMHSWSFVKKWSSDPGARLPDTKDMKEFDNILDFVVNRTNIQPVSTSEFNELIKNERIEPRYIDFVPELPVKVSFLTYSRRWLGINRENVWKWILGISPLPFFFLLLWLRTRKDS